MKIYSNVNRFLEEISTAVTADNKFIDKSEVYHALMKAILLDGVTVAPNVVLSLDEFEDVLRDLANKGQSTTWRQDDACCQGDACASCEPSSCHEEENDSSDGDSADDTCGTEDCSSMPSPTDFLNHPLLGKLLDKNLFINDIDYDCQPDGTERLTIESIEFH